MVKALFLAGNKKVIADECHINEKIRRRWDSPLWTIEHKYFYTTEKECIRRAESENDSVIIPVIKSMALVADFLGEE